MNYGIRNFIRNFSYTLASNFVSLVVTALVVFIVPRLIGVEDYGYFQLYLFYSSYVGFFHFGWSDGVYLRYGGKEYKELDKKLFFSQFYMLFFLQAVLAAFIFIATGFITLNANKIFILQMTAICLILSNVRVMLLYILQSTNRIKEYAQVTIFDRVIYCGLFIVIFLFYFKDYKFLIAADLIGKLFSLIYAMYYCRDIVFCKISLFYFSIKEAVNNISAGIKLMFSNLASTLIIGVVRFGIERSWNVATFGKVSLTLSVSNFMMLFINAVGIIMFPALRRTDDKELPEIYLTINDFMSIIMFGSLIIYYPLKVVLSFWLPQYRESLMYMALLVPVCVYEGKMALLVNTYLKTLRKENQMLRINLLTLVLSIIITSFNTVINKNLNLAIVSIVVLLTFRCIIGEIYLSKVLKVSLYKDILLELLITVIFIIAGWYVNSWPTVFIYTAAYLTYLFIKQKDIKTAAKKVKLLFEH